MRAITGLLAAALVAGGCAHRGAVRIPGPLTSLGKQQADAADEGTAGRAAADQTTGTEGGGADTSRASGRASRRAARRSGPGQDVGAAAASFVGKSRLRVDGQSYRYDCSGFVCAAYKKAGVPLDGNSAALYALARQEGVLHKRGRPQVGDVAFFSNTYDRNRNGRRDDDLTHVAVVESVDAKGTAVLVHIGSKGVTRLVIDLAHPSDRRDAQGNELNSILRSGKDDGRPRLSGELFVGWGSLWAVAPDPAQVDAMADAD